MIELDPLDALALTLHHSPGVQALLLGSGVSRPAGVPTGWEITLDLVRRLANTQGIETQSDWAEWYRAKYDKEPSYSEILHAVASAPAERRSIIHSYIEARKGDDIRRPTKAHEAIARLVALGSLRVIVTTNFDRLLESALRDVGVEPTVIASDDALIGATPLVHSRCTVIKLHGDYMDARIKNTADELERYSKPMDRLLDRVFDEYGLIVAGWSGEWDAALRNAILRTTSRRYPFYWASRGEIPQLGKDLIEQRNAREIRIADADTFFAQLLSKVEALRAMNRAHPESVALTVAEGKRLCREERLAAEWSDLVAKEVERFTAYVKGDEYPHDSPTNASLNLLVRTIVARSETLRRLMLVGVRWGTDEAFSITLRGIAALTFSEMDQGGFTWLISLRQLAASMCFQWAVGAAVLRGDFGRVAAIMHLELRTRNDRGVRAVEVLPLAALESVDWKILEGFDRRHTPHSDFFAEIFVSEARDVVVAPADAEQAWDEAEFLIAMEAAIFRLPMVKERGLWFWVPPGRFVWQRHGATLSERLQRMGELTADSPELRVGLFGGTPEAAKEAAAELSSFFSRAAGSWI